MKRTIFLCLFLVCALIMLPTCKSKPHQGSLTKTKKVTYPNMVRIPSGSFKMGDHFGEGNTNELPVHIVYVSGFWMDKYEVTNKEYKKCVYAGACTPQKMTKSYTRRSSYYGDSRYNDYPLIYVTWDDACKYCEWKGGRLPTEAEWEYAARGGLSGARYPNGNNISKSEANYDGTDTTAVGSYPANGYGLYDMAGNVFEWVSDWYGKDYYSNSPASDPQGLRSGRSRVFRGGSWDYHASGARVSDRRSGNHSGKSINIGFRCVRKP